LIVIGGGIGHRSGMPIQFIRTVVDVPVPLGGEDATG